MIEGDRAEPCPLRPVGYVRSSLKRREDCPPRGWEGAPDAWLEIDPAFATGLEGITPGNELVLLTWLHEARRDVLRVHPRGNPDNPLRGVFATRSPDRPNPIGLHRVEVIEVEKPGRVRVRPLEVLDGTPIVDIKSSGGSLVGCSTKDRAPAALAILNADDWGRSPEINAAVMQAHRQGMLTSASLMVTGEAFEDAVRLARATPTLAVGLHLVVVNGRAALPHKEIPHLVDSSGGFPDDPLRVGLHYAFSRAAQAELAKELAAQFDRFAATGLPLSHVDSHQHLHVHPVVFNLLLPLAEQHGAYGVRLPRDDLWLALRHDRDQALAKVAWAVALALICRWCAHRMRGRRLVTPQRVYGVLRSGRMHEAYVVEALRHLEPAAELYFHPSLAEQSEALGPNRGDLATLLSPAVRRAIAERGPRLTTYQGLYEVR